MRMHRWSVVPHKFAFAQALRFAFYQRAICIALLVAELYQIGHSVHEQRCVHASFPDVIKCNQDMRNSRNESISHM